jgi:hypothetical protein
VICNLKGYPSPSPPPARGGVFGTSLSLFLGSKKEAMKGEMDRRIIYGNVGDSECI